MTIGNKNHTVSGTPPTRAAPLIVIVEEQPAVRELLRLMLVLAGYRSRVYADMEAILTQREQPLRPGDDPAVLLLDVSLHPAAEAAEYVRRVRVHWQESCSVVPSIILLTTQPQVRVALGSEEQVLLKPFHVHDLLALIHRAAPVGEAARVDTR